jgi:hypothetical protein
MVHVLSLNICLVPGSFAKSKNDADTHTTYSYYSIYQIFAAYLRPRIVIKSFNTRPMKA